MNGYFLQEDGEFVYNKNGDVIVKYKSDEAMTATFIITVPYMVALTLIEAIANLFAVIKYHSFKRNNLNIVNKNDTNLLCKFI